MGLGYLCAWKATEANEYPAMMWAMIVLVSIGTGFFKGNVYLGINGRLFPLADQDELDTVLFNLQYMFVNIRFFLRNFPFHWLVQTPDTVQCS